jgi:cell division protein FtsQ
MNRSSYVYSAGYGGMYKKLKNREKPYKKRITQIKKTIKYIIILSIIFVFIFIGSKIFSFFTSSPIFSLKEIKIDVKSQRTKEILSEVLDKYKNKNLFLLNTYKIKDQLGKFPEINEIVIKKEFPSSIVISVKERIPFIMLKNHKYFLIDRDGYIIKTSYRKFKVDVPIIFFNGGDIFNLLPVEELKKFISSEYYKKDMVIYFIEPYGITVFDGNKKIFLGKEKIVENWRHYLWIKKNIFKGTKKYEYIDLRFNDRAYIMPLNGGENAEG